MLLVFKNVECVLKRVIYITELVGDYLVYSQTKTCLLCSLKAKLIYLKNHWGDNCLIFCLSVIPEGRLKSTMSK